jgi:uncharacterized protein involved in outer membrane biogenesis
VESQTKRPRRRALTWTAAVLGLLAIAIAILIAIWDWNWFRGPLARAASARMHREVTIDGDLRVHPFSWQPSATVSGVHVANPAWAGKGNLADIGQIAIQIRLVPLLAGHLDMRLLRIERPRVDLYRDAQGRATWDFSDGKAPAKPLKLPPIHDFVIDDGHVDYSDVKRRLKFTGTLNASEELGRKIRGFEMRGQGDLNAQPFTLRVTGGPLLNINKATPYPFDVYMRAGETVVTARGAVPKPFDLAQFHMDATARGPDLADLYGVIAIPLPNTPPYQLRGRLSRDVNLWRVDDIGGRVGSSDMSGWAQANIGGARPVVKADLLTHSLDFLDVGALFGGSAKVGKVASAKQVATARAMQAEQRLLPDAPLDVQKIRSADADVTYKALSIHNAPLPLSSMSAHVTLNNGLMRAAPLAMELPQGRVAGEVQLDARKAVPATDLDLRLTNARLEQLAPLRFQGRSPFAGAMAGRAKLHAVGGSVHKAFAAADGDVSLVVPNGEIRKSVAELMGVDVTKGLGLLLSKNQDTAPIRCGVAHFSAVDGVFKADQLVFDTEPVLVTGSGTINMSDERLDLKMQGHPKHFQLVRLRMPVTAQGTLLKPKLGVQPGGAILQGGAAVALGVFLTPVAAILPFIDPGLTKDANCAGLIAEAKAQGALVRAPPAKVAAH